MFNRKIIYLLILYTILGACCKREEIKEHSRIHYEEGKKLFFDEGDFEGAYLELKKAVDKDPDFEAPYLNFMLGYIYERKNLYKDAIHRYFKELEYNKRSTEEDKKVYNFTLFYLAETFHKAGLFYKALYNTTVNALLNYYNGRLYLNDKMCRDELKGEGLEVRPQKVDYLHFFKGIIYSRFGVLERAISELKKVNPRSDFYWRAQAILSKALYEKGDTKKAKDIWIKLSSKRTPSTISELGYIWAELGLMRRLRDTVKYCKQYYKLAKAPSAKNRAIKNLAWIYFKEGKIKEAYRLIEEFDHSVPEAVDQWGEYENPAEGIKIKYFTEFYDPSILDHKADTYLGMSIKYYREFLKKVTPKDASLYLRVLCKIGTAKMRLGRFDEAISIFKEILSKDSERVSLPEDIMKEALIRCGVAYYLKGMKRKAFSLWRELRNPTAVMNTCVRLGIELKGWKEEEMMDKALGIFYFNKGLRKRRLPNFSKAIMYLERRHHQEWEYDITKNDPILLLDLANAYYNRHFFEVPPKILFNFREYYIEAEAAFNALQATCELWKIIKWNEELGWGVEWWNTYF
jgi:tetratricopeptide (TPR) repeat protein